MVEASNFKIYVRYKHICNNTCQTGDPGSHFIESETCIDKTN